MLGPTRTARGDDGNRDRVRDRARKLYVVAVARPVPVHARQQNLARAQAFGPHRPLDRVETDGLPTAVRVDLPARARVFRVTATRVYRDDHALTAEDVRAFRYQLGPLDG